MVVNRIKRSRIAGGATTYAVRTLTKLDSVVEKINRPDICAILPQDKLFYRPLVVVQIVENVVCITYGGVNIKSNATAA